MPAQHRFLALAAVVLLLLTVAPADEVRSSHAPSSPASSQAPPALPGVNSERILSGKSEASGESESTNPLERMTTGVAPASFAVADRSHTDEVNGDVPSSDAANLGSLSPDPPPGDTQSDPAVEVAVHSHESQESLDQDGDSEESLLASQGL